MRREITFDIFVRRLELFLLIVAVFFALRYLSGILLPFFIAWLFAYLLYPVVRFIEKKLHIRVRVISIIITLLLLIAVIGLIFMFIVPPMIDQFRKLSEILTAWLNQSTHTSNFSDWFSQIITKYKDEIDTFLTNSDFTSIIKSATPKIFNIVGQTASVIISIIASLITLLYMFFILLDYEFLTENWIRIFPKKNRPFWQTLMSDVEGELNKYIRGQGLIALCMAVMFCIGFTLMDFPMAIGLGIMIGLMDLIPYLHSFALIPTAFLAMLKSADTGQSFWLIFGLAVGLFILTQLISDMILTPKIMGKAMNLNPAILLLSLSVWGYVFGFIGLIIALPLTTLLMAYWKRYITKETDEEFRLEQEKQLALEQEGADTDNSEKTSEKTTK